MDFKNEMLESLNMEIRRLEDTNDLLNAKIEELYDKLDKYEELLFELNEYIDYAFKETKLTDEGYHLKEIIKEYTEE